MKVSLIFTLFPALLFYGCANKDESKVARESPYCLDAKTKSIIKVAPVAREAVTEHIHLTGSIEANPDQVIHFISLVDGVITQTYFSLGDVVTKGQVLAEMESTKLSSLQAERTSLKSQIEIAEIDLEAQQQMHRDGISSNKEWVAAQNALRILKSEKQKVENHLRLYRASDTKNVFQIKAPASGIITEKNINPGSTVTSNGEYLFAVSNLNSVWAVADIYATDLAHITEGMEVEIKTLSYPDEVFRGKIEVISHVFDRDAKVLKARIVLGNHGLKLKPGMIADIEAVKKTDWEAVVVPLSALVFFHNQDHVLVYNGDCEIDLREVHVHTQRDGRAYLAGGLSEEEKVIIKNQLLILEEIK